MGYFSIKLLTCLLILSFASPVLALVFGGSNLSFLGYPSNDCSPPYSKPYKPYQFNSQFEIDMYNLEVMRYNAEIQSYTYCIKEYIENAKNDIRRIQEKIDEAIEEANSQ